MAAMRSTCNRSVADVDADKLPLFLPTGMRVTWMRLGEESECGCCRRTSGVSGIWKWQVNWFVVLL